MMPLTGMQKIITLWKLRRVFDYLNAGFRALYNPTEHLAIDEVIVKFKGKVVFRQFIPKKRKRFGIKLYKLCDSFGYTYDMNVYLGKQRKSDAGDVTATHGTVLQLVRRMENKGHKIYMESYFSFFLISEIERLVLVVVRHNRKDMPANFGPKQLKLKKGDIVSKVRDNLTAICWKGKRVVYMLSNIHPSPANGNFLDEHGNATKPYIVEQYNTHMGHVDKSDRMSNTYSICRRTWKWTKKLFFHFLDLSVLNAFLLHKSSGRKLCHILVYPLVVRVC
jgi:hypothetical protein